MPDAPRAAGRPHGRSCPAPPASYSLLPFYGDGSLQSAAIGREALKRTDRILVSTSDWVRFGAGIAFIAAGLVLLAAGTVNAG